MFKKFLLLVLVLFSGCSKTQNFKKPQIPKDPVPIIELPYYKTSFSKPGWEERGPEFAHWNSTGVRIGTGQWWGSGTMSYYDRENNYMYVISCGHLFFQGRGNAEYYRKNPTKSTIEVFYHNDEKLENFESYDAEVLCHVWQSNIYDVSLLRFHPKWANPWTKPVAPMTYAPLRGEYFHNVGCDGRSEVAHYLVKFSSLNIRMDVEELICVENAARGGRSGGGLFSENGRLIGITSRSDGISTSYYSSHKQIHKFLIEEGYGFVLQGVNDWARQIPIIDRNNPQNNYPKDYIPLPNN